MNYKHGHAIRGKNSSEYRTWVHMKERCNNPNDKHFKDYSGREIQVCERWQDFRNFFADMGPRPNGLTLERKDNDGNYEPGNCRWATWKEQAANTRNLHWFCGHGPNGEMIIENNQSYVARIFELSQTGISQCLLCKHSMHKGWRFQWM